MFDTLKQYYNQALPYLQKLYAWSPFVSGLLLGYFGKPLIQWALDIAFKLV